MRRALALWCLLALGACDPSGKDSASADRDGDGVLVGSDCDDTDASVYPEAEEVCDEVDNDCDGEVDEGLEVEAWYADADGDGHAGTLAGESCGPPGAGASTEATDCDDADAAVFPGATEVCNRRDDDCDTLVDDEDPDREEGSAPLWYEDLDEDGWGGELEQRSCIPPRGWTELAGDCDDADASAYPGAPEDCNYVDQNCDGLRDPPEECGLYWAEELVAAHHIASKAQQWAGYSGGIIDDQDGDGLPDLILGSGTDEPTPMRGWIVSGATRGEQELSHEEGGDEIAVFELRDTKAWLESTLDCDVDGDGQREVVLGTAGAWLGEEYARGLVSYFRSPRGLLAVDEDADGYVLGADPYDSAGFAVACGNFDGDAQEDLLIGAPGAGYGSAYVVHGPIAEGHSVLEEAVGVRFEGSQYYSLAAPAVEAGDVDGDGLDDVLVGAPDFSMLGAYQNGAAFLILGPATSDRSLLDADTIFRGEAEEDHTGDGLAVAPDQDGDGRADLFIGGGYRFAYVINGPPPDGQFSLAGADARVDVWETTGVSDSLTALDLDGDGLSDLAAANRLGSAVVKSGGGVTLVPAPMAGNVHAPTVGRWLVPGLDGSSLGDFLAAGDVDGDGRDDLWTGATADTTYRHASGAGWLFLGPDLWDEL